MSEADEIAQAIFEQNPEFFPITDRKVALTIATGQCPEESFQVIDGVADALMEIKPCK